MPVTVLPSTAYSTLTRAISKMFLSVFQDVSVRVVLRSDDLAIFVMLQGGDHDLGTETRLLSHTAHCCDG